MESSRGDGSRGRGGVRGGTNFFRIGGRCTDVVLPRAGEDSRASQDEGWAREVAAWRAAGAGAADERASGAAGANHGRRRGRWVRAEVRQARPGLTLVKDVCDGGH